MTPKLLAALPYPALMKRRLRMWAMLDAIMAPEFRAFEFHPAWSKGEQVGAFKDGSGNHFFAWFSKKGAVVRGFDHESEMSPFREEPAVVWPGMWKGLPKELVYATREPAFGEEEITFACWSKGAEGDWMASPLKPPKADGAQKLLFGCFSRKAHAWASAYYDQTIDARAMELLWRGEPLDRAALEALNPSLDGKEVRAEAKLLGWEIDLGGASPKVVPAKLGPKAPKRAPKTAAAPARARSFGEASFTVHCEPDRVSMKIHGTKVVASVKKDVYDELFELVKKTIRAAKP